MHSILQKHALSWNVTKNHNAEQNSINKTNINESATISTNSEIDDKSTIKNKLKISSIIIPSDDSEESDKSDKSDLDHMLDNIGITKSISVHRDTNNEIMNFIGHIKTDALRANVINCQHCYIDSEGDEFTCYDCPICGFLVNISHITFNKEKNKFVVYVFEANKCKILCKVYFDSLEHIQKVHFKHILDYLYKHPEKCVSVQIKCKKFVISSVDSHTNILTNNLKRYGYDFKVLNLKRCLFNADRRKVNNDCVVQ